jgi:hypothetical protein|tara:strand:- start:1182 stop:1370 length:189 start_codon:yes stop_codon:yes gene_type:complete
MLSIQKRREERVKSLFKENRSDVKQITAGFWGPLMTQDDESAKANSQPSKSSPPISMKKPFC